MKKTETCMHITSTESIAKMYDMVNTAYKNFRESIRKECKESKRYHIQEQQYLFFFKRKVKIEYTADEYKSYVVTDADIDHRINQGDFSYRNNNRLVPLQKFISYAHANGTAFDLSMSDYEYLRLWNEKPTDWHTRYNAALY